MGGLRMIMWIAIIILMTVITILGMRINHQDIALEEATAHRDAACDLVDTLEEELHLLRLSNTAHQRVWRTAFHHAMSEDPTAALAVLGDWMDTQ